ncbi:MAG: hypothetical protein JWQ04_1156 [Pedosphaera sp.]|nr:hypothetical protein [Pedosphaera sp.]
MDTKTPAPPPKDEPAGERLLLFSLADFWSLIEPLLIAAAPKKICEIGLGQGDFTRLVLGFCARNNCHYAGIDPGQDGALANSNAEAQAEFYQRPSLSVLSELPAQDVYFVDGDHNYHTVLNELRLIRRWPENWPLVILHDVGWPWARRDHYYAPETIPEAFRHLHSPSQGVITDSNESGQKEPGKLDGLYQWLVGRNEPGLREGANQSATKGYDAAMQEGGPRNGVLTAIEDFLREPFNEGWKLVTIPAVFGLGILYAPQKCAPAIADHVGRLEASVAPLKPLLALLERNRLELFAKHLGHVEQLGAVHENYSKLDAHAAALLGKFNDLLRAYEGLDAYCQTLSSNLKAAQQQAGELKEKPEGGQPLIN